MALKAQVSAVLNKKMDRQGFLKHVAIGVVALSGAGTALKLLSPREKQPQTKANGYGGSAYGG